MKNMKKFRYEKYTFHHNFIASWYLTKPATVVCTSTLRSEDVKFVFLRNVYSGNSLQRTGFIVDISLSRILFLRTEKFMVIVSQRSLYRTEIAVTSRDTILLNHLHFCILLLRSGQLLFNKVYQNVAMLCINENIERSRNQARVKILS